MVFRLEEFSPNNTGKAMTVKGPIDPDELGITLLHEHLFIWGDASTRMPTTSTPATIAAKFDQKLTIENLEFNRRYRRGIDDNFKFNDEKLVTPEAMEFRYYGGSTLVDLTNIGIRRDPHALLRVSNATGLNVVMGSSWYIKDLYPPNMDELTITDLEETIKRDITIGVGNSGIRSGIIGEVGIQGEPLTTNEIKVMQASARASRATGAPISIHWGGTKNEKQQIADIIQDEGGDLSRTVFGHSDLIADDLDQLSRLLERGIYIEFDITGRVDVPLSWGNPNPDSPWLDYTEASLNALIADTVCKLIELGYIDRIILSQDVCQKKQLKSHGGTGYSFLLEHFLPNLKKLGVSDKQIRTIMVENPKRILTFAEPQ